MARARLAFAPRLDLPILIMLLVGLALRQAGLAIPEFTDRTAYEQVMLIPQSTDSGCDLRDFYGRMAAIRTWRWPLKDGGEGLILAALTLGSMRLLSGIRHYREIATIPTPGRIWPFFAWGTGAIGLFFCALVHSFVLGLQRSEFPWCADSVAIPMFGAMISAVLFWLVAMVVGLALTRFFGALPVPLNRWNPQRPIWSWMWTVLAGIVAALLLIGVVLAPLQAMPWAVPAELTGLYLVLAARAGIVGRGHLSEAGS